MNQKEFGTELRKIRISQKMTQRTLAMLTGIHYQHISSIERGVLSTSFEKRNEILEVFDTKYQLVTKIVRKKSK